MKYIKTKKLFETNNLSTIINSGSFDRIKEYINNNIDFSHDNVMITAVHLNIYLNEKIEIIKYLIKLNIDLDYQSEYNGMSAIYYAYDRHYYQVINLLIDAGANLLLKTTLNKTLLFYINCGFQMENINDKLLRSIDWSITDNDGKTFLESIYHEDKVKIIDLYPELYEIYLTKVKAREFNI